MKRYFDLDFDPESGQWNPITKNFYPFVYTIWLFLMNRIKHSFENSKGCKLIMDGVYNKKNVKY